MLDGRLLVSYHEDNIPRVVELDCIPMHGHSVFVLRASIRWLDLVNFHLSILRFGLRRRNFHAIRKSKVETFTLHGLALSHEVDRGWCKIVILNADDFHVIRQPTLVVVVDVKERFCKQLPGRSYLNAIAGGHGSSVPVPVVHVLVREPDDRSYFIYQP